MYLWLPASHVYIRVGGLLVCRMKLSNEVVLLSLRLSLGLSMQPARMTGMGIRVIADRRSNTGIQLIHNSALALTLRRYNK